MVEHKHAGKQETFLKEYSGRKDLARKKNKRQVGISLDPEDFCHFSSNQMDFP